MTGCACAELVRGANGEDLRKEVSQDQREDVAEAVKGEEEGMSNGSMNVPRSPWEQERV